MEMYLRNVLSVIPQIAGHNSSSINLPSKWHSRIFEAKSSIKRCFHWPSQNANFPSCHIGVYINDSKNKPYALSLHQTFEYACNWLIDWNNSMILQFIKTRLRYIYKILNQLSYYSSNVSYLEALVVCKGNFFLRKYRNHVCSPEGSIHFY